MRSFWMAAAEASCTPKMSGFLAEMSLMTLGPRRVHGRLAVRDSELLGVLQPRGSTAGSQCDQGQALEILADPHFFSSWVLPRGGASTAAVSRKWIKRSEE